MAIEARNILKTYFETGDQPTELQFSSFMDSFYHQSDGLVITGHSVDVNGNAVLAFSDSTTRTVALPALPANQDVSYITGLQGILDNKADKVSGKGLSTHDLTTILKDKLDNLSNYVHPATHSIAMITGLSTVLNDINNSKVDKVIGKDLSDNNGFANN